MDRPLWVWQQRGIDDVVLAFQAGHRVVGLTSPTGMGKTRMVEEIVKHYAGKGFYCVVYTNRRLLTEQLAASHEASGLALGVRAAGHQDLRERPVQIASLPTEFRRTLPGREYGGWQIHGLGRQGLAVIDEAHSVEGGECTQEIIRRHLVAGHLVLKVTATWIDVAADFLVTAGSVSEGQKHGALVRAVHYAPDEPHPHAKTKAKYGCDLTAGDLKGMFPMSRALSGRVIDTFRRLNPEGKPSILFAAGVDESLWFAQEFVKAGISAAHIDGDCVWLDGKFYEADRAAREAVLDGNRGGTVRVLCNRFVLREGVDCPWLAHGILATTFGSLQSYLQSGGRLLRSSPGLASVVCQDHGGNYWRWGSLNADRQWQLDTFAAGLRATRDERLRTRAEPTPYPCPQCSAVVTGRLCFRCGWEAGPGFRPSRWVVETDDRLVPYYGEPVKKRAATRDEPGAARIWAGMWHGSRPGAKDRKFKVRTFEAMYVAFHWKHGYWPRRDLPYMPREPEDWHRHVHQVPVARLVPEREGVKS